MKGRIAQFATTWASVVVMSLLEVPTLRDQVVSELVPVLKSGELEESSRVGVLLLAKALRELRGEPVPAHGTPAGVHDAGRCVQGMMVSPGSPGIAAWGLRPTPVTAKLRPAPEATGKRPWQAGPAAAAPAKKAKQDTPQTKQPAAAKHATPDAPQAKPAAPAKNATADAPQAKPAAPAKKATADAPQAKPAAPAKKATADAPQAKQPAPAKKATADVPQAKPAKPAAPAKAAPPRARPTPAGKGGAKKE